MIKLLELNEALPAVKQDTMQQYRKKVAERVEKRKRDHILGCFRDKLEEKLSIRSYDSHLTHVMQYLGLQQNQKCYP